MAIRTSGRTSIGTMDFLSCREREERVKHSGYNRSWLPPLPSAANCRGRRRRSQRLTSGGRSARRSAVTSYGQSASRIHFGEREGGSGGATQPLLPRGIGLPERRIHSGVRAGGLGGA